MTLALLIYTINTFSNLKSVASATTAVSSVIIVLLTIAYLVSMDWSNTEKFRDAIKAGGIINLWIIGISLAIQVIVPSERTSYMMVGGYIAENISTSDQFNKSLTEAGNLTGKLTTIINNKLDGYIKETEKELTEGTK